MAKIKIEKGIKMWEPRGKSGGRKDVYPWREMKKGDSFFIPSQKPATAQSAVARANKRYAPKKFAARTMPTGVRIWRVK